MEYDKGDKVVFVEADDYQVRWGGNDDPREVLKIGDTYIVESIEVHNWHTKVTLEGIEGRFNSAHFKKVGEP